MRIPPYTKVLARIFLIGVVVVVAEHVLGGIKDSHMKSLGI